MSKWERHAKQSVPGVAKSLDEPVRENQEDPFPLRLADTLPSPDRGGLDWLDRHIDHERCKEIFGKLTEFEQEVLRMRFWEDMTLDAIGKHFGRSRERIRQILMDIALVAQEKERYYSKGGWWIGKVRRHGKGRPRDEQAPSNPAPVCDDPWASFGDRVVGWVADGSGGGDGEGEEGAG